MARHRMGWWVPLAALLLAGCAMVTVNVYFPDEDVKDAYDEMATRHQRPAEGTAAPAETAPAAPGPQGSLPPSSGWGLVTPAEAATSEVTVSTEQIVAEMEADTLVVAAYGVRGRNQSTVIALFTESVLGLAADGKVAQLPPDLRNPELAAVSKRLYLAANPGVAADSATAAKVSGWLADLIAKENAARETIIGGMANAMLRIARRNAGEAGIGDERSLLATFQRQARKLFVDREVEHIAYGWWYTGPDGTWVQNQPPQVDLNSED